MLSGSEVYIGNGTLDNESSDEFDPYYVWLSIPPGEQPPDHYRLLGLAKYEENREVISTAADRQTMIVRAFQSGRQSTAAFELLNEIAAARLCLLNVENKAEYDRDLRASEAKKPAPPRSKPPRKPRRDVVGVAAAPVRPPVKHAPEPAVDNNASPLGHAPQPESQSTIQIKTQQQPAPGKKSGRPANRRHNPRKKSSAGLIVSVTVIVAVGIVALIAYGMFLKGQPTLEPFADLTIGSHRAYAEVQASLYQQEHWRERVKFKVTTNLPRGARINPSSGLMKLPTLDAETGKRYQVTVRVEAIGNKRNFDEKSFYVVVGR